MEYKLANGTIATDEDLERDAQMYEDGTWEGGFVEIRFDCTRLGNGEPEADSSLKAFKRHNVTPGHKAQE